MTKLLRLILVLAVLFLISACDRNVKRPKPTQVVYQETLQEDDTLKVVRTCTYSIDSVKYDTIHKREKSTIEPRYTQTYRNLPEDAVDLNSIFGKYDNETDWNFTELYPEDWEYLNKLGVYWDDGYGCYRKKSTEQRLQERER